jgi:autotransporter-associated beta strand protein
VSDVFFTANSAINLTTTLGADFSIKSLNFTGAGPAATNSVTIGGGNLLTIGTGGVTVQTGSANHVINTNTALGASQTWTVTDLGNTLTVGGIISGGATESLTKAGSGTLLLTGNNTYAGPTNVNAGTLLVNGTHTGGGLYTVGSGGTLGGSGSITAAVVVNSGGTISPGNSPDAFNTGSETWNPAGSYLFEINDATGTAGNVASGWDLLEITGSLNLGTLSAGNEFEIELVSLTLGNVPGNAANFVPAGSYAWLLADVTSAITSYTGSDQFVVDDSGFSNLFTGAFEVLRGDNPLITALVPLANNTELYVYYANNNAAVVPEPSTYALGLLGLVGFGLFAWRKRKS